MTCRGRFKGQTSASFRIHAQPLKAPFCGENIDSYSGSCPLIHICINRLSAEKHVATEDFYRLFPLVLLQLYGPLFFVSFCQVFG